MGPLEALWRRRSSVPGHVLVRELQGEAVILNLNDECYVGLDEIATRMWNVMRDAPSLEAAYEQLLGLYEVDADRLRADLAAFVESLARRELIVLSDA